MAIGPIRTSTLVSNILNLAQTSVYQIKLAPPADVKEHLRLNGFDYDSQGENIELLCNSAVLPGTSLSTHEVIGDYQGVRERMAYRRQYDDTVDLTFYVDHDYKVVEFFNGWVDYISGQGNGQRISNVNARKFGANYRMNYPASYKTNMYIVKFEKDVSPSRSIFNDDKTFQLTYTLVNSFPINIISTPISYEGSQVLKFSVSMSMQRYTIDKSQIFATGDSRPSETTPATTRSNNNRSTNGSVSETTLGRSGNPSGESGNTNGPGTQFVPTDSPTGFRLGANDGPLLLPDGSPAYDANGNLRSMF